MAYLLSKQAEIGVIFCVLSTPSAGTGLNFPIQYAPVYEHQILLSRGRKHYEQRRRTSQEDRR